MSLYPSRSQHKKKNVSRPQRKKGVVEDDVSQQIRGNNRVAQDPPPPFIRLPCSH